VSTIYYTKHTHTYLPLQREITIRLGKLEAPNIFEEGLEYNPGNPALLSGLSQARDMIKTSLEVLSSVSAVFSCICKSLIRNRPRLFLLPLLGYRLQIFSSFPPNSSLQPKMPCPISWSLLQLVRRFRLYAHCLSSHQQHNSSRTSLQIQHFLSLVAMVLSQSQCPPLVLTNS
jgi:hypothetical protein